MFHSNDVYTLKMNDFRIFCQLYDKHINYYNFRVDDILKMSPEYNSCTVYYDKNKHCFVFESNNWCQYISDEIFEPFNLYKDNEFTTRKEELYKLYKPGFFEAYRNGGQTYHAQDMERLIKPLLYRLYEYKINFRTVRRKK